MRSLFVLLIFALLGCALPASTTPITQNISQTIPARIEVDETPGVFSEQTPDTVESETTPVPISGAFGPWSFPDTINPLTGLTVTDENILHRRPIVVKVSNAPSLVRPQAGISGADIVFEHYVEGGLTRFSAVFYGQSPERVGSIRSARLIDHEIVPMFDGMLAFSGASIGVEKYIYGSEEVASRIDGADTVPPGGLVPPSEYAERAYKGVLYGLPYYWRDDTLPIPHNMFTNLTALWTLAAAEGHAQRPNLQGLAFHPDPPPGESGSAITLDVRYLATRVGWEYHAETGAYLRFADGLAHQDANTQTQVSAANVVILYAAHTDTDIVESEWQGNISWSTQIAVWGENQVTLCRDGRRYDGYWTRTIREHIISLRTADGEILYLKPGNTWFQIVREVEQQLPDYEWVLIE